jgi:hypothetical protein
LVEYAFSTYEALDLIPSTTLKKKKKERKRKRKENHASHLWLTPVILATWAADSGESQ